MAALDAPDVAISNTQFRFTQGSNDWDVSDDGRTVSSNANSHRVALLEPTFGIDEDATLDLEVTPPPGGCQIMIAQFVGVDYFLSQGRDTYRTEADEVAESAAQSGSAPPLPPQEPEYAITFSSDGEMDGADQVPVWAVAPWQRRDHIRLCYNATRRTVTLARNGGPPSPQLAFAGGPPPAPSPITPEAAAGTEASAPAAPNSAKDTAAAAATASQQRLCVCVMSQSDESSGASRFHVLRALNSEEAALYTRDASSIL